jgi:hypothetical protein
MAEDRKGNLIVAWDPPGKVGPPSIYNGMGEFVGTVGRPGQGPGEIVHTLWVTAGDEDTVRLYDWSRVLTFSANFEHVSTSAHPRTFVMYGMVVRLPGGSFVALGGEALRAGQPRPIHLQRSDGSSRLVSRFPSFNDAGQSRVLAPALDGGRFGRFWVAQFSLINGSGFDLYLADTAGVVTDALRHAPNWWHRERTSVSPLPTGTSRVVALREIQPGVVAVLVAQPKPNWADISIDTKTFAGIWNRYDTVLEIIDVREAAVIGRARVAGYPRALLRNQRLAVYRELEDGVPVIEVLKFHP